MGSACSHILPEYLARSSRVFLGPCRRAAARRTPFSAQRPRATGKKVLPVRAQQRAHFRMRGRALCAERSGVHCPT